MENSYDAQIAFEPAENQVMLRVTQGFDPKADPDFDLYLPSQQFLDELLYFNPFALT